MVFHISTLIPTLQKGSGIFYLPKAYTTKIEYMHPYFNINRDRSTEAETFHVNLVVQIVNEENLKCKLQ